MEYSCGVLVDMRSFDLDPGVVWYMLQSENMTANQFNYLVNHESGLLGVSEISAELRNFISHEASDNRAGGALAVLLSGKK